MTTVLYEGLPHTVLREVDDWGIRSYDLVAPPRRLWADQPGPHSALRSNVDPLDTTRLPTPGDLINSIPQSDNWSAHSKRSLARLQALALIAEDPQRRLDARDVVTLAHQVSLVRHIADHPDLRRVLIGDEVGLGKTVEAGLLLGELLENNPGLRILYFAPARLVSNVAQEFSRMQLNFRQWKAQDSDARIESDSRIIASIHRAVHPAHFDRLLKLPPWDVIIVDECHHLSDWAEGGGDPVRKYRIVRELVARQPEEGHLLLLSGTPHQGHEHRFNNLLKLLRRPGESDSAVAGRVIFRTKEDVKDWDGNPLFPRRQVNPPKLVELGPEHTAWLDDIHSYFHPVAGSGSESVRRAAGWKCAQALQWAASSTHAGLGYLVRQALRAGWTIDEPPLRDAIASLRPYRTGSREEPVDAVYQRLLMEIRRQEDAEDLEDIENMDDSDAVETDRAALSRLLKQGISLVRDSVQPKWETLWRDILKPAGAEKVVLFAQPIETVMALASWLEDKTGERPAIIIGGQTEAEREKLVSSFRRPGGPRFLISSRAGGEGFNLQVARRLVHLDVPWNPMEMEQRVGRVHRFGSRHTVLVDTLVVRGSRETHAWSVARERLNHIASTLVSADRFEALFSRVMCLIPPEELQTVLIHAPTAPLGAGDVSQLSTLVDSGFQQWQEFHDRFSENQRTIRSLNPGIARWDQIHEFLIQHGGARETRGFKRGTFVQLGDDVEFRETPAKVVQFKDSSLGLAEDFEGGLVTGDGSEKVRCLGLNVAQVCEVLRECALPEIPTGAAHLRWNKDPFLAFERFGEDFGILGFIRQLVRIDHGGGLTEVACELHLFVIPAGGGPARPLDAEEKNLALTVLSAARIRMKPAESVPVASLAENERLLLDALRRPSDEQIREGLRFAVWPILAAHVSP